MLNKKDYTLGTLLEILKTGKDSLAFSLQDRIMLDSIYDLLKEYKVLLNKFDSEIIAKQEKIIKDSNNIKAENSYLKSKIKRYENCGNCIEKIRCLDADYEKCDKYKGVM